jgi:hypothetical protein
MRHDSKLLLRLLLLHRPRLKPSRQAWCVRVYICCSVMHVFPSKEEDKAAD